MSTRNRYTPQEIAYIKQALARADKPKAIAEGLKKQFNSVRSEASVSGFIHKLRHGNEPKPRKKNDKKNEDDAGDILEKISTLKFKIPEPEFITSLKKGEYAYHPECGAVVCQGMVELDGYGEFISLAEIYPSGSPKKILIPKNKLSEKRLRKLYDTETLGQLLKLISSQPSMARLPGPTQHKQKKMEVLVNSSAITGPINVVLLVFNRNSVSYGSFLEIGLKALRKLTTEYAVVQKTDIKQAEFQLTEALQFKSAKQLSKITYDI